MKSVILVYLTIISTIILVISIITSIIFGVNDQKDESNDKNDKDEKSKEITPTPSPTPNPTPTSIPTPTHSPTPSPTPTSIPTPTQKEFWETYDYYLIAILWPPSSCYMIKNNKKQCFDRIKEEGIEQDNTIHGLWPQSYSFINQSYYCNPNEKDYIEIELGDELKNEFTKIWPGLFSNEQNLWKLEYNKHGYCYIQRMKKEPKNNYIDYFIKVKEIYEKYNFKDFIKTVLPDFEEGITTISKKKFKQSLNYSSKYNIFRNSFVLQCNGGFFDQIFFSLDLDFNPTHLGLDNETCGDTFMFPFKDENGKDVSKKIDYYVFAVFWLAGECKGRSKDCYKEIKKDKNRIKYATIHGLWPSFKNGAYPRACNFGEDIIVENFTLELQNKTNTYWYAAYNGNKFLWTHEYNRHGFCFNKIFSFNTSDYEKYFSKGIEIYEENNFRTIFTDIINLYPGENKYKKSELKEILEKKFPKDSFVFNCNKNNNSYLSEIWFKMDMNFKLTNEGIVTDGCKDDIIIELIEVEGPQKQDDKIKDNYDCYVLSITWPATYCMEKGDKCFEKLKDLPKNIFNIHGLWPSYISKEMPDWCNGKNDIEIEIKDEKLLQEMKNYWAGTYRTNEYYWGHEYNKHGYCYNKRNNINEQDYEKYFNTTLNLFKELNLKDIFINMFEDDPSAGIKNVKKIDFLKILNLKRFNEKNLKLNCYKNKDDDYYLGEVLLYLDLNFNPLNSNEKILKFNEKNSDDCPDEFKIKFLD